MVQPFFKMISFNSLYTILDTKRIRVFIFYYYSFINSKFRVPNSAMHHMGCMAALNLIWFRAAIWLHRLVTRTFNPIWESFSAVLKASSLVSNCPTLTR